MCLINFPKGKQLMRLSLAIAQKVRAECAIVGMYSRYATQLRWTLPTSDQVMIGRRLLHFMAELHAPPVPVDVTHVG